MSNKKSKEDADNAPWILMGIVTDLKGEREPAALVRTPDGDKEVPLSETKGKVNLFDQLPDYAKRNLVRDLMKKYKKWAAEGKPGSEIAKEDK